MPSCLRDNPRRRGWCPPGADPGGVRLVVILIVLVCGSGGCSGCDDTTLATLKETDGAVDRDFDKQRTWRAATPGARFQIGDGLRTGVNATALLDVAAGGQMKVESETIIRFLAQPPDQPAQSNVDVEIGHIILESADRPLRLQSATGIAIVEPGSRVRIGRAGNLIRYEVQVGLARFKAPDQPEISVPAGQRIQVDIATARIDKIPPLIAPSLDARDDGFVATAGTPAEDPKGVDGVDTPQRDGAGEPHGGDRSARERNRDTDGGKPLSSGRQMLQSGETLSAPVHPDFVIPAGESSVVHDPNPPSLIALDIGDVCPQGGAAHFGQRWVRTAPGGSLAIVSLKTGKHGYQIHCQDGNHPRPRPQRAGVIRILRDSGTAQLPRTAPASMIDTDGRRYTVLYQNLLPQIDVHWPRAPTAKAYALTVTTGARVQTIQTGTPHHRFKSAELNEGTHVLRFTVPDGPKTADTTLTIRFDNAAPAAVVKTPADRGFQAGQRVAVSGLALPGWTVTAGGQDLTLDAHHRFSGDVHTTPDDRALAIRFEQKGRGVHYYLRRPTRSTP